MDVLLRLSVCRSTSSLSRASLLHVLICQARRSQPELPDLVSEVLRSCRTASETPLAQLANDIAEFQASATRLQTSVDMFWPVEAEGKDGKGEGAVKMDVPAVSHPDARATTCVEGEADIETASVASVVERSPVGVADALGHQACPPLFDEGTAAGETSVCTGGAGSDVAAVPVVQEVIPDSMSNGGVEGDLHQKKEHHALASLLARASAEAYAMEQALNSVRKEAAEVLAYFADSAASGGDVCSAQVVDGRSHEFLCVLRDFAKDFEQARADLARSRKLADSCGWAACSSPSLEQCPPPLEGETLNAPIFEDDDVCSNTS